jgi:hypothetical protein
VVALACNPSTREAEAGGFLSLRPAWATGFQDSQDGTEKPCLKKNKKKKKKKMGPFFPEMFLVKIFITAIEKYAKTRRLILVPRP